MGKQAHEKRSPVISLLRIWFNSRLDFEYDVKKDASPTLGIFLAAINHNINGAVSALHQLLIYSFPFMFPYVK